MNIIIGLLILSSIIAPIAIYKRSKSLQFRIVECATSHQIGCISKYCAQVRIHGVWFWLNPDAGFMSEPSDSCHLSVIVGKYYLDAQDALILIEQFKSTGNFTIPSNRKLNSNEKQIIVE